MNQKGIVVETVLVYVLVGVLAIFVSNPVSSFFGIGARPNKSVLKESYKETVELLKDKDGNVIGSKTVARTATSDEDKQQHVSFWEQIKALPILWVILMVLGLFFPVVAGIMAKFNGCVVKKFKELTSHHKEMEVDVRKIVTGVDAAFATIPLTLASISLPGEINRADLADKIVKEMKRELRGYYDESTKQLVRSVKQI